METKYKKRKEKHRRKCKKGETIENPKEEEPKKAPVGKIKRKVSKKRTITPEPKKSRRVGMRCILRGKQTIEKQTRKIIKGGGKNSGKKVSKMRMERARKQG